MPPTLLPISSSLLPPPSLSPTDILPPVSEFAWWRVPATQGSKPTRITTLRDVEPPPSPEVDCESTLNRRAIQTKTKPCVAQ
eukprot:255568-Rhodomonas_salina.1